MCLNPSNYVFSVYDGELKIVREKIEARLEKEGLQVPDRGPQRCARRELRHIPVSMIRRGAEAAPHADFTYLLLPQKNCLSNERRLSKMKIYRMKIKKKY